MKELNDFQIYFSDFFEVSPERINKYGAFDISMVNDLPLFVDPFLLFNSAKPAYKKLHKEIIRYVGFLKEMSLEEGIQDGLLKRWFYFPEVKQNWFGYSRFGNQGSGLGQKFAASLNKSLNNVFLNFGNEEISRGSHLEKLCLIKGGVGRDNISDFTTNLIKGFLLEYTQAFAVKHVKSKFIKKIYVDRVKFNYKTRSWERGFYDLPCYFDDFVLLTPLDILTKDETWINSHDLSEKFSDIVDSIPNSQLRGQINQYLLSNLPKKPKKKEKQAAVSKTIGKFPEFLDYYIKFKEDSGKDAERLSSAKVSETYSLFVSKTKRLVSFLFENSEFYNFKDNSYNEAFKRVMFLKDAIENKDGYRLFYVNNKPLKREEDLQIMFRLTWFCTPYDVNREVNNGRGPVDFKVSMGSRDVTLVEFKLASNTQLKRNLKNQVKIYEKANNTKSSIKVILYFSEIEYNNVIRILKELELVDDKNIILIDASKENKISASRA